MKIRSFLQEISVRIVPYLTFIFAVAIVLVNLVGSVSFNNMFSFNKLSDLLIIVVVMIVMATLICFISGIENEKKFVIVLFSIAFIIRLIWVLVIKTEPSSDFAIMYDGAQNIVSGNYSYILESSYFKTWVYQLGFTMYLAGIIKVFGNYLLIIKLFNVIIVSLIPVVIYFTGKRLGSNKGAKIASLSYCFYIASIVNTSVLTNQHLATLFFYVGIYLLVSNVNRKYKWIFIGILIGLGDVIRPEGAIIIIGILLFIIFKNILNYKELGKSILEVFGSIIVIILVSQIASFGIMKAGISKDPLINKDPLWKFVSGINPETKGTYSEADDIYLSGYSMGEERTTAELGLIKERLSNPKDLIKTMAYKVVVMWGTNDTSMNLSFTDEFQNDRYMDIFIKMEKIQYMILMIMFLGSSIIIIKKKEGFKEYYLYLIIFIGYFLAHLLIEVQPRYRYFSMPIFFIMQVQVLELLLNRFKDYKVLSKK